MFEPSNRIGGFGTRFRRLAIGTSDRGFGLLAGVLLVCACVFLYLRGGAPLRI